MMTRECIHDSDAPEHYNGQIQARQMRYHIIAPATDLPYNARNRPPIVPIHDTHYLTT